MKCLDKVKYIQVYINKNTTVYYNRYTGDYIRHTLREDWRPSIGYYVGIPLTLFAGDVIDPYYKEMVVLYSYIRGGFILLCVIMAFICFEAVNKKITDDVDKEGVPLFFLTQENIQSGMRQLRQQCGIILSLAALDLVVLLLSCFLDLFLLWIMFVILFVCVVGIIATVRPLRRKKLYYQISQNESEFVN